VKEGCCQIVPPQGDVEQKLHSGHYVVTIAAAVAVSGERLRKAAKRLQLSMWLRWEWGPNLRAAMSSIMR